MGDENGIKDLHLGLAVGDVIRIADVTVRDVDCNNKFGQRVFQLELDGQEKRRTPEESLPDCEYVVIRVDKIPGGNSDPDALENLGVRQSITAFSLDAVGRCDQEKCDAVMFRLRRNAFAPDFDPRIRVVGQMEIEIVMNPKLVVGKRLI